MNITLFPFQLNAIKELYDVFEEDKKNIILQSCTGSGKTIILTKFIHQYMSENENYVTIWFCPGKGNLEEQSKVKMDKYIKNARTKTLQDVLNIGFEEGDTVFINWELVTKKGNRAFLEGEKKNLEYYIRVALNSGLKFIIVIDEEHLNKTIKSYDIVELFKPKKIIRASATPQNDVAAYPVVISENDVIEQGLIKRALIINEDIDEKQEINNQSQYLLNIALKKQHKLRDEFNNINRNINPLIIIQVPNKSESIVDVVEKYLNDNGLTYENGKLAIWLTDKKENLYNIEDNNSLVNAIIIKQAVATGWDCPRAYILVKLRENMSETFEIQTIGRIRRMPEAKHYNNTLLDTCYLYTFDEKFKEGVKQHLNNNVFNGKTLKLKDNFKNISLKKETIGSIKYEIDPIYTLMSFKKFLSKKYKVNAMKFKNNITYFKKNNYDLEEQIKVKTYSGKISHISNISKKDLKELHQVILKINLNTHIHGRMFHKIISKIARNLGLTYNSIATIIRKLFCENPLYDYKVLNLTPKQLYAFIINNQKRLEEDLQYAITHEMYSYIPLTFLHNNIEEKFNFPKEKLFLYDESQKNYDIYNKNIYEGYMSSAIPRSQGEKIFEMFCEKCNSVEWFYKNGDKGNEFFSIVYEDNSTKKHHFYPDYILSISGKLWILEVKGGESEYGKSEDVDIYSEKKMKALLNYAKENKIEGGFVRYNKKDMRLYINVTGYKEQMNNDCWTRLDKYFT